MKHDHACRLGVRLPSAHRVVPDEPRLVQRHALDLAADEEEARKYVTLRNQWINRVYAPEIRRGEERTKRKIPLTAVAGLEDKIVTFESARSYFENLPPATVEGDHITMKLPKSCESDTYLVLSNVLSEVLTAATSREPDGPAHPRFRPDMSDFSNEIRWLLDSITAGTKAIYEQLWSVYEPALFTSGMEKLDNIIVTDLVGPINAFARSQTPRLLLVENQQHLKGLADEWYGPSARHLDESIDRFLDTVRNDPQHYFVVKIQSNLVHYGRVSEELKGEINGWIDTVKLRAGDIFKAVGECRSALTRASLRPREQGQDINQ